MLRPAGLYGLPCLLRALIGGEASHPGLRGLAGVLGAAGGFLGGLDAAEGDGGTVLRHFAR